MVAAIACAIALAWWQAGEQSQEPLASAQDTAYLSCVTWKEGRWTDPASRSMRTKMFVSPKGFRAYAEVQVAVKEDGSCENTTTLYASGANGKFKSVYVKAPSASDGNGIRVIGWSPSGDRLLAEVNLWKYETDLGYMRIMLVFDPSTGVAREIAVSKLFARHFGGECEFDLALEGWGTNEQVRVKVSKGAETEAYEQRFCVEKPQVFSLDLKNETVKAIQQVPRKRD